MRQFVDNHSGDLLWGRVSRENQVSIERDSDVRLPSSPGTGKSCDDYARRETRKPIELAGRDIVQDIKRGTHFGKGKFRDWL
jgi:hypothetical protein